MKSLSWTRTLCSIVHWNLRWGLAGVLCHGMAFSSCIGNSRPKSGKKTVIALCYWFSYPVASTLDLSCCFRLRNSFVVYSRIHFVVFLFLFQFAGSPSSTCRNASQLCHNQPPFNSYFWNNYKNESPRQVLKTRILLISFQRKLFVTLKSFHWFHIFR